jgi:hypothetical protein
MSCSMLRHQTERLGRRLLLAVSHGLAPDALDHEWESGEHALPYLRDWVVQIKQAVLERALQTPSAPQ